MPRPAPLTKPCSTDDCPNLRTAGSVACSRCWRLIPAATREHLAAVFRRREQDPAAYVDAVDTALGLIAEARGSRSTASV